MSTVTEAPERPATGETASAPPPPGANLLRAACTVGLAGALVAIAFLTGGGLDQSAASAGNTWIEIVLTVIGALAVGVCLVLRPRGERRAGWIAVGMMTLLTADVAASIAWSWAPDSSWLGAAQMVAYLAVFAAAVALVRPWVRAWSTVLGALALWSTTLCAWSLLVKVFPSALAPGNQYGRLQAPFGYWNAIALCAAMGLPACVWLGARRDGGRRLAALATPALTLIIAVLVLSYSRSADVAAAVALGVWLLVVPLRLRAIAMLLIAGVGAGVVSAWFLTHHALDGNQVLPRVQSHAGPAFGLVLLVVLVLVTIAGVAVSEAMDRYELRDSTRRQIGGAIVALGVLAVIAVVAAVAMSSRGLSGEISYRWHELTNPTAVVSASNASRVFQFGSSRPVYWHEALAVGDSAPLKGVGELGFSVARLQHPLSSEQVFQAHSYVFETYADLGVLGLVLSGGLLAAWLAACGLTLGAGGRRWSGLGGEARAERIGLVTLAAVVLAFGIQSTLDWTWYVTGVAVPALLAAGWLAGGARSRRPRTSVSSPVVRRGMLAPALLLAVAALVACWFMWRPLDSLDLVNAGTLADAHAAQRADPFWLFPYDALSVLDSTVNRPGAAVAALQQGTREQPHNPQAWESLAQLLIHQHRWTAARPVLEVVHDLDLSGDSLSQQNDRLLVEAASHP